MRSCKAVVSDSISVRRKSRSATLAGVSACSRSDIVGGCGVGSPKDQREFQGICSFEMV